MGPGGKPLIPTRPCWRLCRRYRPARTKLLSRGLVLPASGTPKRLLHVKQYSVPENDPTDDSTQLRRVPRPAGWGSYNPIPHHWNAEPSDPSRLDREAMPAGEGKHNIPPVRDGGTGRAGVYIHSVNSDQSCKPERPTCDGSKESQLPERLRPRLGRGLPDGANSPAPAHRRVDPALIAEPAPLTASATFPATPAGGLGRIVMDWS